MISSPATMADGSSESPRKYRKLLPDSDAEVCKSPPEAFARSYQLEALEMAKRQNTIAFLETGSGKTLIAIMLLRSYAYCIRKPSEFIAVFLVPTVVLVTQQAEVVETHTDLKVGRFWGEMGVDNWSKAHWEEQLEKFEVFVMTPQILLNNLRHCFFMLEKIKLLIFDECHNARKRSPYACIMTEFYHRQLELHSCNLPRVFGMTASLVNSRGSSSQLVYSKSILELETLMNSKVFTVANESVLAQYVPFATPKIKPYEHLGIPHDLKFYLEQSLKNLREKHSRALQKLRLGDSSEESARTKLVKLENTFGFCLSELGVWLAAKVAESLLHKEHSIFFWGQSSDKVGEIIVRKFSNDVSRIFLACLPANWEIGNDIAADINGGILTSKVQCLIASLSEYRRLRDLSCIIFVERVVTAIALHSLLCHSSDLSGWKTQYMAGNQSGMINQTRKEQLKIVNAFREGKVNIIVATQILEEGLDVQSCNLVIRFDLSATVCSFIQSRGRARMQGSDYLLFVRSGDSSELSKVNNYLNSVVIMREESLKQSLLPCKPLETEMCHEEFYRVESTGAIVTLSSSVPLIYLYCSRLPADEFFMPHPRFDIDKESNCCTLHLPNNCPVETIYVAGRSDMLKQIACLEACKKLHEIGELSDYLLPTSKVSAEDEIEDNGGHSCKDEQVEYFPGELVGSWLSFSDTGLYYCYKITLNQMFIYTTSPDEIILVVKSDLGPNFVFNSFSLATDRGDIITNIEYVGVVHLTHEQVLMARKFQINILSILIHHDFAKLMDAISGLHKEQPPKSITYLLLPSNGGKVNWRCVKSAIFSMNSAKHSSSCKVVHIMQTKSGAICGCMLKNSIVYTPHNGRFYCVTNVFGDLDGNSALKLRSGGTISYKKYFQTKYDVILSRENESLLDGRHPFMVHNFLLRRSDQKEKESGNAGVELPPELCIVIMCPISVNTLYTFSFAPSIMHRIQGMLLAARLNKIHMGHCMKNDRIPTMKMLEALTTKKCHEEFSLESLETLGDSFLKYVAGQHLFTRYKHHHEGILSAKKNSLISNAALCRLGCNHNLAGFIRTEEFGPKQWLIPGDSIIVFMDDETSVSSPEDIHIVTTRYIKRKVIADSVEALIGAHLSASGELAAIHFMKWLGMEIDFRVGIVMEGPIIDKPETYVNVKDVEFLLKYSFKNPSLLIEALTHGSYQLPGIRRCYQRLEFLGDAVLDYLITLHLYYTYPGITPGLLTDLRSASVNNDCYAHAAVKANLNRHVLHASSELHRQMASYLKHFTQVFSGSSYGWDAGVGLPKVLGDIIESIAGAIYVDSGYNKETVWASIKPLLEPLVSPETVEHHPVRELEELCSKKSFLKSYSKTSQNGVASITARVEANGAVYEATRTGANRKSAKMLAAKSVLMDLKTSVFNSGSH